MSRKKNYEVEGQLCFDLNTNSEHYVVQANELLEGKQNLKLNSAKIMRAVIMQIKPDDTELKSYLITVPELSKMLGVSKSNLYRDIDNITDDILKNHVVIKEYPGKFIKIQWVSACAYESGVGLAIKLNPLLKPFLLGLQSRYTQYALENILAMRSVYSIRIYELLQKEQILKVLPRNGAYVVLSVREIREACDCESKFERISQFKEKVLDVAVKDFNRCTCYFLSYECLKNGRVIENIRFFISWVPAGIESGQL